MSGDYLWNRSGERDPEIARLESLLGRLGHRQRPLDLEAPQPAGRVPASRRWTRFVLPVSVAAALILVAGGFWLSRGPKVQAWTVESVVGMPALGARTAREGASVSDARWMVTDAKSSLSLRADDVGQIDIGPGTRVRVVASRAGDHRLALEHGSLRVTIWASPGQFAVDTPAATAVDLGCRYTLEVDLTGSGVLHVTSGWVGVERDGRASFVPEGAVCIMRPGRGPGAPRFDDVPSAFASALDVLDGETAVIAGASLESVLAKARPRDAMTVWHLLTRKADRSARERIYDRLAVLAPPPPGLDREAALAGDRAALDAWWNSFGLGNAELFRKWKMRAAS
jgi:hypothetical protein